MPVRPSFPGVFVQEIPSGARSITGTATSIAAFIGRARRGPVNEPTRVRSFAEFVREFGGLWRESMMSYSVQHFFLNGGSEALVVRVVDSSAGSAVFRLPAGSEALRLAASSPGDWGNSLRIFVDHGTDADPGADPDRFDLSVHEVDASGTPFATETFRELSLDPQDGNFIETALEASSRLVRVHGPLPTARPDETVDVNDDPIPAALDTDAAGSDGGEIGAPQISDPGLAAENRGLWALEKASRFNLLCIPPFAAETDTTRATWDAALAYCGRRRAMLIVDSPSSWQTPADVEDAATGIDATQSPVPARDANAAIYFPRVRVADPEQNNALATFVPCGLIAGVFARTDAQRGVWKAPAGREATLIGARELAYDLNGPESGQLNTLAVNPLRRFAQLGHVVWGARTTRGADQLGSEWKYVPVRRLALFLEQSIEEGIQWAVFEPNDEPLWAAIRASVGAFLHDLFRQGAFQGASPREAYFVKLDAQTTTESDRNRGIFNLQLGFAPLRPAEFVILTIRQRAGQVET